MDQAMDQGGGTKAGTEVGVYYRSLRKPPLSTPRHSKAHPSLTKYHMTRVLKSLVTHHMALYLPLPPVYIKHAIRIQFTWGWIFPVGKVGGQAAIQMIEIPYKWCTLMWRLSRVDVKFPKNGVHWCGVCPGWMWSSLQMVYIDVAFVPGGCEVP